MVLVRTTLKELREKGRPQVDQAKIDATTEEDIARHMEEDGDTDFPDDAKWELVVPIGHARRLLGVTEAEFAELVGISEATVREWEDGLKVPDPIMRTLLKVIAREPEAVARALNLPPPRAHDTEGAGDADTVPAASSG
ncbi:MAG TPA: transcriptional regulator [Acetobacteraceae bacterium]|nr:transcriptional regulator [Acetobacteraceae bacterium]